MAKKRSGKRSSPITGPAADPVTYELMTETMEYLMKRLLSAGADDIVLRGSIGFGQQSKIVNNRIAKTWTEEISSISIFSVWKRRIVETSLKEFSRASVDGIVKKASVFAKHLPENKEYGGIADGPFQYAKLPYDPKISSAGHKQPDIIEGAVNSAIAAGAERVSGTLEMYDWRTILLTSHSVRAEEKLSSVYFSLRAFADKAASGHKVACGRRLDRIDFDKTARAAAEIAVAAKNPQQGPTGRFDLVIDPLPFSDLLERVGSAASAFDVDAGLSFLAGKIGEKVGSEQVTLTDDATLENGYHSTAFDSEGVPTRKTTIIDKGVLRTYLHNTSTAKRYNAQTTANAGLIAPHHWNLVLEPGRQSKDELICEVKNGMYITNTWYTRFQNYVKGDFSTLPRDGAFMIRDGKLGQPIRGIRISSNMIEMLKSIAAIGKDAENIHSWEVSSSVVTPPVILRDINITRPVA